MTDTIPTPTTPQPSMVEEAKKVMEAIKAENDRRERILAEEQKLHAERILAGTNGGNVPPQPVKEETAKEYAERVMKGNVTDGKPTN